MFMTKSIIAFSIFSLTILIASSQANNKDKAMVEKKNFGKLADGTEVFSYTLKNAGHGSKDNYLRSCCCFINGTR